LDKKIMTVDTVRSIVENMGVEELRSSSLINSKVLERVGYDPDMLDFYIGMEDGYFVTGSGWQPPNDYDPTQRPWYKKVLRVGKATITDAYLDMNTGKISITGVSPIKNKNGRIIGSVGTDIYLDSISKYVENIDYMNGYGLIVGPDGTLFSHPVEDMIGQNMFKNNKYSNIAR